jgi:hypothetical protein
MNFSYFGLVEGSLIIAVFFATSIMLIVRALKIKKIFKNINWRYVQEIAAKLVDILTIALSIVLLIQAKVNKSMESKVSFTF